MRMRIFILSAICTGSLLLAQEIGQRSHHDSGLGGFDKGRIEKPGPMHVPTLKLSGHIVSFSKLGFTVADKDDKETVFLCCEKRTEFEAKKDTPLGRKSPIVPRDFHIGDEVDVYYEALHNVVSKLRLVKRPTP